MFYLQVCPCPFASLVLLEAKRGHRFPRVWSHRWLLTVTWVSGIKSQPSGEAVRAPNHLASLPPSHTFSFTSHRRHYSKSSSSAPQKQMPALFIMSFTAGYRAYLHILVLKHAFRNMKSKCWLPSHYGWTSNHLSSPRQPLICLGTFVHDIKQTQKGGMCVGGGTISKMVF